MAVTCIITNHKDYLRSVYQSSSVFQLPHNMGGIARKTRPGVFLWVFTAGRPGLHVVQGLPHYKTNSIVCCQGDLCNNEAVPVPNIEPTGIKEFLPAPKPKLLPTLVVTESKGLFEGNYLVVNLLTLLILLFIFVLYVVRNWGYRKAKPRVSMGIKKTSEGSESLN
ncbi:hypothetical protein TSAR_012147, partial [Trichomalopsis sarcophagae]